MERSNGVNGILSLIQTRFRNQIFGVTGETSRLDPCINGEYVMSNKSKLIVALILLLASSAVTRAEDPEASRYPIEHPVISSHAHHVAGSSSFLASRQLNWEERANADPS